MGAAAVHTAVTAAGGVPARPAPAAAQGAAPVAAGPIICPPPLDGSAYDAYRRRAIFSFGKLDPQCGDVCVLAPFPLMLGHEAWRELAAAAEALDAELLECEHELVKRPELHRALGLPAAIRRALRAACESPPIPGPRFVRYDFHLTTDGWRISEVNSDVPGGFLEATALPRLMGEHYSGAVAAGDPTDALVDRIADRLRDSPRPTAALVHATAYSDDRQVMVFLQRALAARGGDGVRGVLCAPNHLRWPAAGGRAAFDSGIAAGAPDLILRFYPGEWLPNLRRTTDWRAFFAGSLTPQSNPPTALLTQSKRLPLLWDRLACPAAAWRRYLPETRDPRDAPLRAEPEAWVLKPALGRVGDMVAIRGVSAATDVKKAARWARLAPRGWIAQRRFEAIPVETAEGPRYPCIGVFVIDGRAAGAYGRLAARPLIDAAAQDIAVLITRDAAEPGEDCSKGAAPCS